MSNSNLADKWFDAIDDIDEFLEELVAINEHSLESSPLLEDFCQAISVSMNDTCALELHDSNPALYRLSGDISSRICEMSINVFEVLSESCISDIYSESMSSSGAVSYEINESKELYSIENKLMNKAA